MPKCFFIQNGKFLNFYTFVKISNYFMSLYLTDSSETKIIEIQISSHTIKIPLHQFLKHSQVFDEIILNNDISNYLTEEIAKIQQLHNIKIENIVKFFELLKDENVKINNDDFLDFCILYQRFKVSSLNESLKNYANEHFNDIDYNITLLLNQEKGKDINLYNIQQPLIEEILSKNIKQCIQNPKFWQIPIEIIYRIIARSDKKSISADTLYDFILKSIDERYILLSFLSLSDLSIDRLKNLCQKESSNRYFNYIPNDPKFIIEMKEKDNDRISQLELKAQESENNLSLKILEFEQEKQKLLDSNQDLLNQKQESENILNQKIQKIKQKNKTLNTSNQELLKQKQEIEKQLQEAQKSFEQKIQQITNENQKLHENNQELTKINQSLKENEADYQSQLSQLKGNKSVSNKKFKQLVTEKNDLAQKYNYEKEFADKIRQSYPNKNDNEINVIINQDLNLIRQIHDLFKNERNNDEIFNFINKDVELASSIRIYFSSGDDAWIINEVKENHKDMDKVMSLKQFKRNIHQIIPKTNDEEIVSIIGRNSKLSNGIHDIFQNDSDENILAYIRKDVNLSKSIRTFFKSGDDLGIINKIKENANQVQKIISEKENLRLMNERIKKSAISQSLIKGKIITAVKNDLIINVQIKIDNKIKIDHHNSHFIIVKSISELANESSYRKGESIKDNDTTADILAKAGTYYVCAMITDVKGNKRELISKPVTTSGINIAFNYGNREKELLVYKGRYKLEVWGAQGGSSDGTEHTSRKKQVVVQGGLGGYSVGTITIDEQTKFFVVVGGRGKTADEFDGSLQLGGYPDGGEVTTSHFSSYTTNPGSGGGSSSIMLSNCSSDSRVIVAGGGGGAAGDSCDVSPGGYGGGLNGGCNYYKGSRTTAGAGTQNGSSSGIGEYDKYGNSGKPGEFGVGGAGGYIKTRDSGGGGGGGWYGGGGGGCGYSKWSGSGGGGSGWVFTKESMDAWTAPESKSFKLSSSFYLADASTVSGDHLFPDTSGNGMETGHAGDGYAKITPI